MVDINLSEEQKKMFLQKFGPQVDCATYIEDLEALIQEEKSRMENVQDPAFFQNYQSYEAIVNFITGLQRNNSFLYTQVIGTSTQVGEISTEFSTQKKCLTFSKKGTNVYAVMMNGGAGKEKKRAEMPTIFFLGFFIHFNFIHLIFWLPQKKPGNIPGKFSRRNF